MMRFDDFEIDRDANAVILRRRMRATPERLYAAWTRPEQIALWWDPTGTPLAECSIDLRVGGLLRLVGQGQHAFEGRYTELDPPYRLCFDAMGAAGSVDLSPVEGQTEMTVVLQCASAEHLAQFVQMGVAEGTSRTLDNLVAFAMDAVDAG